MSERLYALLLRLYSARFREAYREEALQLFRDRARRERGFVAAARLWIDLAGDLAVSVPRSYRSEPGAVAISPGGGPCFAVLQDERPGAGPVLYGAVASLLAYAAVLLLLAHGGRSFTAQGSDAGRSSGWSPPAMQNASMYGRGGSSGSEVVVKPSPMIALSFVPFPAASGGTVHLTATVVPLDSGPTPTGAVRFYDENSLLSVSELEDGRVTITPTLPHLGTHFLRAFYVGDENYGVAATPNRVKRAKTIVSRALRR